MFDLTVSCYEGETKVYFYWFVCLGDLRCVARFGLMSQIGASQIRAPVGSLFQKYVYIQQFDSQDKDWFGIF